MVGSCSGHSSGWKIDGHTPRRLRAGLRHDDGRATSAAEGGVRLQELAAARAGRDLIGRQWGARTVNRRSARQSSTFPAELPTGLDWGTTDQTVISRLRGRLNGLSSAVDKRTRGLARIRLVRDSTVWREPRQGRPAGLAVGVSGGCLSPARTPDHGLPSREIRRY